MRITIFKEEGKDVAYAFGKVMADECELWRIGVLPEFRGDGYGAKALEDFLNIAKEYGAGKVFLEVSAANKVAISLYEKLRFNKIAQRDNYYGNGDDGVVYEILP